MPMVTIETTGDMLTRLRSCCEGRGQTAKVSKDVLSKLLVEYSRMFNALQAMQLIKEIDGHDKGTTQAAKRDHRGISAPVA